MNCRIRPAVAWSILWSAALATASVAAEITEVRIGNHPTFTRVVFQLDAPAGYRIERRSDDSGEATSILVTMEATTRARTIAGRAGMVESVTVEEQLGRAVARIHLRKPKLRLKEMILASPPRIVLDVMHEAVSSTVTKPPAWGGEKAKRPAPAPKATKSTRQAARPKPVPAVSKTKPSETAAVPTRRLTPARIEKSAPKPIAAPKPLDAEPKARARSVVTPPAEQKPRVVPKPVARPKPVPKPATQRPSVAQTKPLDLANPSPVMIAAGVAGAVLVVGGFVLLRRRRRARQTADDAFGDGDDLFPADREHEGGFAMDDANAPAGGIETGSDPMAVPAFGETGDGGLFGDLDQTSDSNPPAQHPESTPVAAPGGSLFGDDEKEESNVDQMSTPTSGMDTSVAAGAMPPTGDLMRMVAELERRLNHAETRLDESVEACERLERQMAAQSEELRVQRAAIARTQRALRSLSRSDEEQATEPAIREPR